MSEIDPRADVPLVDWSALGVSGLLPTGTVTLLLGDVEGSTRLWETQPEQMTAAAARLNETVSEIVAVHDGVRPVEQGEGDSFVVAFARASDALSCALGLQRAPAGPDPAPHRDTHRRGATARRGQLRRVDDQPDCAAARSGPRRPDAAVRRNRTVGGRPTAESCVAGRSWQPPAARSAAPGTSGANVPPRPGQRLPSAADHENHCCASGSVTIDQLRRPRRAASRGAKPVGPQPDGHLNRSRRGGRSKR